MDEYHRAFLYASVQQYVKDEERASRSAKKK
jgi:hypothetical protein